MGKFTSKLHLISAVIPIRMFVCIERVSIRRIFKQLSVVSSAMIFSQQVFGAIEIAAGIFQLDAAMQAELDARLVNVPLLILLIICTLLIYCSIASQTTAKLNENVNVIYTSKWYRLPVEQQHYLVDMIAFAQSNHTFYGLNMLPCTQQTFVTVLNDVMWTFMKDSHQTENIFSHFADHESVRVILSHDGTILNILDSEHIQTCS